MDDESDTSILQLFSSRIENIESPLEMETRQDPTAEEAIVTSAHVKERQELLEECTFLRPVGPFSGLSTKGLQAYLQGPDVVERRKEVSNLIAEKSFGHLFFQGKWHTRQRPVFVRIWIVSLNVKEDEGSKEIDVDLFVGALWRDEAMVGADPNNWTDDDVWHGIYDVLDDLALLNEDGTTANGLEKVDPTPGFATWELVDAQAGLIRHRQRYRGTITNRLRYDNFPFDGDSVGLMVTAIRPKVKIYFNYRFHPRWLGMLGMNEWIIGRAGLPEPASKAHNVIKLKIGMQRSFFYYLINILVVAAMLMVLSWLIFALPLDPADPLAAIDTRTNLALTLFLSMVAFLFVTRERLPKISYLTVLDKILLVAFILVWISGIETWVVYELMRNGHETIADRVDLVCLIASPSLFTLTCVILLSKGFWQWIQFRSVLVACETAVTVMENWVSSLGITDEAIIELAQFREKVMDNSEEGELHEGIGLKEYDPVKQHEIQIAYKVVELKRRMATAMRHMVDSHHRLFKDFDPRDKMEAMGGATYFKLSPYWSSWLVRGYAGTCFKKISQEVFEGEVISVADLISEEFDKVHGAGNRNTESTQTQLVDGWPIRLQCIDAEEGPEAKPQPISQLQRKADRRRMLRRILAGTAGVLTLGLSLKVFPLDVPNRAMEAAADYAAMAMRGGAKVLEAADTELDDEDALLKYFNKTCEPAVDAKGLPTGEMIVRDDPMENRRDERMFWSSLIPVLATKHAQMEPTWHVLDEIVRAGLKASRALLKAGVEVCLSARWSEAAGVAQLGCLAPGHVGKVVKVQSTKELPLAVRNETTGIIWYYKAEELVLADAPAESKAHVKPGTVVRRDNAVRGMRVVLAATAKKEAVPHVPAPGVEGTLVQRGENAKWWKVQWDNGITGAYRVGASLNGLPAFELEFAPVPVPRAQPVANQLVTCITLPAHAVGLKVMPGASVAKRNKAHGVQGGRSVMSQSQTTSQTQGGSAAGGRQIRRVVAGAVGTIKEVDAVGAQVVVEWDVDFEQTHPLQYAQHLLFEGTAAPGGKGTSNAVHPGADGV